MRPLEFHIAASVIGAVLHAPLFAQATQRVSVRTGGLQGNDYSFRSAISADGRYVAFASHASNLVPGDTNGMLDVFVRDRETGVTERVSVDPSGLDGNQASFDAAISADGRFVAFTSRASNLIGGFPGDTNGFDDVFLRDRRTGRTEVVSVNTLGRQGNGDSSDFDPVYGTYTFARPSISADGRFVAFASHASNLVAGDTNGTLDVFVRDRLLGTTTRVSVSSGGVEGDADSGRVGLSISADGRYVAFASDATNLVPGDTNAKRDVFVRDLWSGTTERASVSVSGVQGNGYSSWPSLSADGRYLAFNSDATNLVPGDTDGMLSVFVRDRLTGTIEQVSWEGGQGFAPAISADGRKVAYEGDGWGFFEIYLRDLQGGGTEWISINLFYSSFETRGDSEYPAISADGRFVAFESWENFLVPGDTNWSTDVFVRDRLGGTNFVSLCDPGVGGVAVCPCSNPPNGAQRGCDNSSGTGGASLHADGGAFLSSDSLFFVVGGETSTALSVVLQGSALLASGATYGQGVRCAAGNLIRLYTKNAVWGALLVPRFRAGDHSVSVRSSAAGDQIQPGQSRWYQVYYRDTTVLGGCPAISTFNSTQAGVVTWAP